MTVCFFGLVQPKAYLSVLPGCAAGADMVAEAFKEAAFFAAAFGQFDEGLNQGRGGGGRCREVFVHFMDIAARAA